MEKKAKQNAWSKTNKSVHFIYCCMRAFSDDFRSNVKSSNCLRSIYISIKFPEENSFQSRFIVIKLNSIYYDDIRKWNSHSISFSRIRSVFMSFSPRFHCHFRNVMGNQQSIANHDIRHFIFNCPIHYHWLLNANNINWQIIIFFVPSNEHLGLSYCLSSFLYLHLSIYLLSIDAHVAPHHSILLVIHIVKKKKKKQYFAGKFNFSEEKNRTHNETSINISFQFFSLSRLFIRSISYPKLWQCHQMAFGIYRYRTACIWVDRTTHNICH